MCLGYVHGAVQGPLQTCLFSLGFVGLLTVGVGTLLTLLPALETYWVPLFFKIHSFIHSFLFITL